MGGVFKGWRRKTGCVVALAFAGVWIRSFGVVERIMIARDDLHYLSIRWSNGWMGVSLEEEPLGYPIPTKPLIEYDKDERDHHEAAARVSRHLKQYGGCQPPPPIGKWIPYSGCNRTRRLNLVGSRGRSLEYDMFPQGRTIPSGKRRRTEISSSGNVVRKHQPGGKEWIERSQTEGDCSIARRQQSGKSSTVSFPQSLPWMHPDAIVVV